MADTPSSQTTKARKPRSRNFSEAEKAAIMENYAIHKDLLKSKHASGYKHKVTNQMKDEAWRRITDSVNVIGRAMRTVDEVKGNKIINTCIPSSNNDSSAYQNYLKWPMVHKIFQF